MLGFQGSAFEQIINNSDPNKVNFDLLTNVGSISYEVPEGLSEGISGNIITDEY